jgi:Rrf2 family protein
MLGMSKKTRYALEAVVDIAYNARPDPVQAKDITARQGIPQRYLEQVMQQLAKAGILRGVRGPKGGYRLARERRRISVGEVIRFVEELDDEEEMGETGSDLGRLVVRPLIDQIEEEMLDRLDAISLEELCQRARGADIPRANGGATDFNI